MHVLDDDGFVCYVCNTSSGVMRTCHHNPSFISTTLHPARYDVQKLHEAQVQLSVHVPSINACTTIHLRTDRVPENASHKISLCQTQPRLVEGTIWVGTKYEDATFCET